MCLAYVVSGVNHGDGFYGATVGGVKVPKRSRKETWRDIENDRVEGEGATQT